MLLPFRPLLLRSIAARASVDSPNAVASPTGAVAGGNETSPAYQHTLR